MLPKCGNSLLELAGVSVTCSSRGERETIIQGVDLQVASRELVVIIGDSGSGKSTLLNVIAGFMRRRPSRSSSLCGTLLNAFESPLQDTEVTGRVCFCGSDSTHVQPRDRPVGLVMQRFNLYRHMTVRENLEFPLRMRGISKARWDELVGSVADRLQIKPLLGVKPDRLSGGQEQRVAIGKMLLRFPNVALLDEAFSNLDYELRSDLRRDVLEWFLRSPNGSPPEQPADRAVIFVSHNLDDAIQADQIVLLKRTEEMVRNRLPSAVRLFKSRTSPVPTSAWKQLEESGEIKILKDLAIAHHSESVP
jgi:ABC-type sugar transport system ATPase subunit